MIIGATVSGEGSGSIRHLLLDSRRMFNPAGAMFFAIRGERRNGHLFIAELYRKGVRAFVVSEEPDVDAYPGAAFLRVTDTLVALQELAAYHRSRFSIPVIGITGSNGKTIVKEWLFQLLQEDHHIVRSPRSYNSQTGVPLSVWEMNDTHTLAIFEAGISRPGEMQRLQQIIRPGIGVFTHLGEAHSEGFENAVQKTEEKLTLFRDADSIIHPSGNPVLDGAIGSLAGNRFGRREAEVLSFGRQQHDRLQILHTRIDGLGTAIEAMIQGHAERIWIPFTDAASVENACTCWLVMRMLGYEQAVIAGRMQQLQPVIMRLEVKQGINQCILINDSYSADTDSFSIALNFLDQQRHGLRKTVILSDFLQSEEPDELLYGRILHEVRDHGVERVHAIGTRITEWLHRLHPESAASPEILAYPSTAAFLQQFRSGWFREEIILVKGARVFGFEAIVQLLEFKRHQTRLEINLNAIVHNVKVYQQQLQPGTRIMAMVKAFAYGAGGAEIAGILQFHQVDYLGVAYADEGVELRKAGITLPIMVMNPEPRSFESIVEYDLEPDLYSFELLEAFTERVKQEGLSAYPVHIEVETGMNRLGFAGTDLPLLAERLRHTDLVQIRSVFSHLAASEDPGEDAYTLEQFHRFQAAASILQQAVPYPFLQHIANSAAIFRLPQIQLDMVRLGIGLYGVDSAGSHQALLLPAATLRSTIAQIKHLKKGETVGYNRRGVMSRDSVIATVRIGYADGYSRKLGHGIGKMSVMGQLAPVVGTVCMDMTMIDVTDIPNVKEGEEVIIFGRGLPVQDLANWAGTIPYEIMTTVSQRVQRVYFEE